VHRHQRPLHGAEDVGQVDLFGRPGQAVTAADAALGVDDLSAIEFQQDVLQELLRNLLRDGDLLGLQCRLVGRRQLTDRP
jgi:hypothetical protein